MSTSKINKDKNIIGTTSSKHSEVTQRLYGVGKTGYNISVADVMLDKRHFPVLAKETLLKEALEEMSRLNLGIACLVNDDGVLSGIITDGDIRRKLLKSQKPFSAFFIEDAIVYAIKNPETIASTQTLMSAISVMGKKKIWDLPVVADDGKLIGLLHLHSAIDAILMEFGHE